MSTDATSSEEETRQVAARLAGELGPGTVILLHGDLGAGKTAFVRGLAEGLGVAEDEVSSPTFTLVHEYRGGRLPLYHADLYRLPAGATLDELGLDEVAEEGVLAIEWPERLSRPVPGAIDVRIRHRRRIRADHRDRARKVGRARQAGPGWDSRPYHPLHAASACAPGCVGADEERRAGPLRRWRNSAQQAALSTRMLEPMTGGACVTSP